MRIKLEAIIEIEDDMWYSHTDKEEYEWFISLLENKEDTMLILHNNEVGDSIGETRDFKYKIL